MALSRLTSPIGRAADVTAEATSDNFLGALISSILPQVWHSPHLPTHFAVDQPHSAQRYGSFAGDLAMKVRLLLSGDKYPVIQS